MAQDLLAAHAAAQPDKVALVLDRRRVSFGELNARANRAAGMLAALEMRPGERVAVMNHNSIEGFEISTGARKRGLVQVPVNSRLAPSEVAYLLNDCGARVVLAGAGFAATVEAARPEVEGERAYVAIGADPPAGWLSYTDLMAASTEEEPGAIPELSPEAALGATMIYTSGTTGKPKGAYRPHGLPLELALQTIEVFGLRADDVHLMAGPGYHSAVAYFSSLTVLLGGTVVVMPRFDAEQALELIDRERVTTTFMAPTLLQRIVDLPPAVRDRHRAATLRALILGAAPCPHSLKQRAIAQFGEVLWEFYGATETGVNLVLRPEEQLARPGSCGRPTPTTEVRLLDDSGNPVPDGTPGQLWVRNLGLAQYFNRPEASAQAMRDGFFTVGDIAYRDAEGYFHICDRKVDMIISGGVNIYPAEVEGVLHAHPAVRDVAVIGVPDPHWGESVKAVVELQPGASAAEAELIGWCSQRLAGFKKPRSVDFVAALPRGADGKLLKRQVREPYWAAAGRRI